MAAERKTVGTNGGDKKTNQKRPTRRTTPLEHTQQTAGTRGSKQNRLDAENPAVQPLLCKNSAAQSLLDANVAVQRLHGADFAVQPAPGADFVIKPFLGGVLLRNRFWRVNFAAHPLSQPEASDYGLPADEARELLRFEIGELPESRPHRLREGREHNDRSDLLHINLEHAQRRPPAAKAHKLAVVRHTVEPGGPARLQRAKREPIRAALQGD